jgi:hypothetical protein
MVVLLYPLVDTEKRRKIAHHYGAEVSYWPQAGSYLFQHFLCSCSG